MSGLVVANVLAYSVQLAALVAATAAAARVARARDPQTQVALWEGAFLFSVAWPASIFWTGEPGSITSNVVLGLQAAAVSPAASRGVEIRWVDALAMTLASGAMVQLGRLVVGWLRIRHWRARALPLRLADIDQASSSKDADASRVDIGVTDAVPGPVTVGVWRPMILVPHRFVGLTADVRRAILGHERLHARRRDPLRVLIGELWCACLWFHPGARILVSRLELAREMCLDRETIAMTGDRRAYAKALLAFGAASPARNVPAFIRWAHLPQRVEAITQEIDPMPRTRRWATIALVLALAAAATASAASFVPMPGATPDVGFASQDPFLPGPGIQMPRVVREVKPEYTQEALDAKVQGDVVLGVVVEADGSVGRVTVIRSLDQTYGLDKAAVDAASQWRFEPGRKDGEPVAVRVELEMTFTLR